MTMQEFFKSKQWAHIYSFIKTYATVFIGICLFADQQGTDIFTVAFMLASAKASFIAVLRNFYKLLTEK